LAASTMRSLYFAVKVRRLARGVTSGSGIELPPSTVIDSG
jgi:hypothetical protein